MNLERAQLIDAIRERPDDDAPRYACAAWFESLGDEASRARARFIRLQLESARLPEADTRRSPLEAEALRLLARHRAAWCQGTHFTLAKSRFHRGFVDYVHLHTMHFQHHRRQLFALEPVTRVSVTGWADRWLHHPRYGPGRVERLARCEEWRHVRALSIHHQGPHHDPRGCLLPVLESPHMTGLRELRGTQLSFSAEERRRFERLEVLRRVETLVMPWFDWTRQSGRWFEEDGGWAARQWTSLRSLRFWSDHGPDGLWLLSHLIDTPWWDQLTDLRVGLPDLDPLLNHLPSSLEALSISVRSGFDEPARPSTGPLLAELAERPLQALGLNNLEPDVDGLSALLDGSGLCRLHTLNLSDCTLERPHLEAIAAAPDAAHLRRLNLNAQGLTADTLQPLFTSDRCTSLVMLTLVGTRMSRDALLDLARAQGWQSLRWLRLHGSDAIDPPTLQQLLTSSPLQALVWLLIYLPPDVADAQATAEALASLPSLAALQLDGYDADGATFDHIVELRRDGHLAWCWLPTSHEDEDGEYDVQKHRREVAPDRWPGVDAMGPLAVGQPGVGSLDGGDGYVRSEVEVRFDDDAIPF